MNDCLCPVFLENGEFHINKNIQLAEPVKLYGPVSFLFSCSHEELKKGNQAKVSLPGMFHVIQIYFSIIQNRSDDDKNIFKLDYLQELTDKYLEAFLWMKEECKLDNLVMVEKMFANQIFNNVTKYVYGELAKYFGTQILPGCTSGDEIKYFLSLNNENITNRRVM
jgi:hypothetical protein